MKDVEFFSNIINKGIKIPNDFFHPLTLNDLIINKITLPENYLYNLQHHQ